MSKNSTFKNLVLRKKEEGKLNITFKTNSGDKYVSKYTGESISGPIIFLEITDGEDVVKFTISQDDHEDIFGSKLG